MSVPKPSQSVIAQQSSKQSSTVKQFTEASNDSHNFFPTQLQTIEHYTQLLEKRQVDIRKEELIWDNNFITNELKAALFINYHLIKNYKEQQILIQQLTSKTYQTQTPTNPPQNQKTPHSKENKQQQSNKTTPLKKSQAKSAFEAEKQILSAKHQRQCEEYKKTLLQLEQHLKNNKQQNEYLRLQLLTANDQIVHQNNLIQLMKLQKQQLAQERLTLQTKIRQYQTKLETGLPQNLKHFNCSPIIKDHDTNQLDDEQQEEISFSHDYFFESNIETKLLRKQVEELQSEVKSKIHQNEQITVKMQSLTQTIAKMDAIMHDQSNNKLDIQNIIGEYKQIKRQVSSKLTQIQNYRKIVEEIKSQSKTAWKKQSTEDQEGKQRLFERQIEIRKCQNCASLELHNHKMSLQVRDLREKLNSFLNFQLSQRKQWDGFLQRMKV